MIKNKFATTMLILLGLGAFAFYNSLPMRSTAAVDVIDDYVLYGIDTNTGELQRYVFASSALESIGTVRESSGTVLTGIEASAYIPGFANIYGFWRDPADDFSKLLYINAKTASAAIVGADLGEENVTGATASIDGTRYRVYAVTSPDVVNFTIVDGAIIPSEAYATKFTVLGAALTNSGTYDMPITVQADIGADTYDPFGAFTSPVGATVNDAANPREFVVPTTHDASDAITLSAQTWVMNPSTTGAVDSDWTTDTTVDSSVVTPQVIILKNGDDIPSIPGFADLGSIRDYLEDYVDLATGRMVMGANQAIYLFEFSTTDLTSADADFQDLAVLVTLAIDLAELTDTSVTGATISGEININPNNSPENFFTLVKPDTTEITRDELRNDSVVDSAGTLYEGDATLIRVNPKGAKAQNSLIVDGVAYPIRTDMTYTITGTPMTARVYNDSINSSGKATGHWRVQITVDTNVGDVDDGTYAPPAARLIEVNNVTAGITHMMDLDRTYTSLTSSDGVMFYAFSGTGLYKIDAATGTEALVGTVPASQFGAFEYAGADLYGFDVITNQFAHVDPFATPLVGTAATLGTMQDLGTMIVVPLEYDPALYSSHYD